MERALPDARTRPLIAGLFRLPFGVCALVLYLLLLHAALAVAVLAPSRLDALIDFVRGREERISTFRYTTAANQRRIDATVLPGATWIFGDSIVQQLDTSRISPRALNLGIGGDTTFGLLGRISDHPALRSAATVVLAIGTNDFNYRSAGAASRNLAEIIDRVPAGPRLVLSAVLPVDERVRPDLAGHNDKARAFNLAAAQLCAARAGCSFVDAGMWMRDPSGDLRAELHVGDGLHLSAAGYAFLIDALRDQSPAR